MDGAAHFLVRRAACDRDGSQLQGGILASLVGEGTDQLSTRLSPAATGIVQSGLGNLPELFIAFFSLRAGLVVVVQSALIGSILANSLLVLGLAAAAIRLSGRFVGRRRSLHAREARS